MRDRDQQSQTNRTDPRTSGTLPTSAPATPLIHHAEEKLAPILKLLIEHAEEEATLLNALASAVTSGDLKQTFSTAAALLGIATPVMIGTTTYVLPTTNNQQPTTNNQPTK